MEADADLPLPEVLDVALHCDCDVVDPSMPVDFIFGKVMERFDFQEPDYEDVEAGEALDPDDYGPDDNPWGNGVRRKHRLLQRPSTSTGLGNTRRNLNDRRRQLQIATCPRCKSKSISDFQ